MNNKSTITLARSHKIDRTPGSMYNSWRSKIYTRKGKAIGFPEEWNYFHVFENDMKDGWEKYKILIRKDVTKPYSKDNCIWVEKGEECYGKLTKLLYKGYTKTLVEWCNIYHLNYNGVRQRFFRGKDYTSEMILFGKRIATQKDIMSIHCMKDEQIKRNKISKMLSAYKCKDKKRGYVTTITLANLSDIILNGKCIYCGDSNNIGLDRIDNTRGHEIGNVVPCCYECNVARNNNFSFEEMKTIGKAINQIKLKRNEISIG